MSTTILVIDRRVRDPANKSQATLVETSPRVCFHPPVRHIEHHCYLFDIAEKSQDPLNPLHPFVLLNDLVPKLDYSLSPPSQQRRISALRDDHGEEAEMRLLPSLVPPGIVGSEALPNSFPIAVHPLEPEGTPRVANLSTSSSTREITTWTGAQRFHMKHAEIPGSERKVLVSSSRYPKSQAP